MAMLGEVPFRHYYGTIDGTPLFVMLAWEYFAGHGRPRDGARRSGRPSNSPSSGWTGTAIATVTASSSTPATPTRVSRTRAGRTATISIFHADGHLAKGPIALCEVQGYVYAAKNGMAKLAALLGHDPDGRAPHPGGGEPCASGSTRRSGTRRSEPTRWRSTARSSSAPVRSSNAGHALFTGIAKPERAARVAETLLCKDGFNGWGVRTIAKGEARYNPMSYHNGSIWPHDNALIAMGLARYDRKHEAARIFQGMFDTSLYQDQKRLPELFCGFMRRTPARTRVSYPVACSPQAWAAAAPFAFLAGLPRPRTRPRAATASG
ncbi:amylo-alpha-1,6-glucosidase [Methylobacterium oryzae CBMB20]